MKTSMKTLVSCELGLHQNMLLIFVLELFWHLTKKMHITTFLLTTYISKMFLILSKYFNIICRFHSLFA